MKKLDYDNLFPTLPNEVSERIDKVVNEKMSQKVVTFSKKRTWSLAQIAAAIIAVLLVVPTGVYAANKAYQAYVEHAEKYQYVINIDNTEAVVSTPMKLQLDYVPEDLHYNEDGPFQGKYTTPEYTDDRGMTCVFYKMPDDGIKTAIDYTLESETWTTDKGNTAILLKRDMGWNQLWVAFTDTNYAAQIYVNGFTEDEVRQLADGASLIKSDEEAAFAWQEPKTTVVEAENQKFGKVVSVGDVVDWYFCENVEVKIDSLTVQGDFNGITTDAIGRPMDYSKYISVDGTIETSRQIIKYGDGKNSLNTVEKSDTVTEKVIVLELSVTNTGNNVAESVNFCPALVENKEGTVVRKVFSNEGYSINRAELDNLDKEFFSFETNHESSKNNLINLQPGEIATVKICFLIDEDQFENSYIQLAPGINGENYKNFIYVGDLQ